MGKVGADHPHLPDPAGLPLHASAREVLLQESGSWDVRNRRAHFRNAHHLLVDCGIELRGCTRSEHKVGGRCALDRKSTRLNSSHGYISYAVFCLKKKKNMKKNKN